MVREHIEKLYDGRCDIYEYVKSERENGSSELTAVIAAENVPCRLSYTTRLSYSGLKSSAGSGSVLANKPIQQIKLFLSPEVRVKAGSRIVVTQNGITESYKNSGVPAVYRHHQEIVLEKTEKWD